MKFNMICENHDDAILIQKIGERAFTAFGTDSGLPLYKDPMQPCMDISAVHLNGCRLNLNALLKATDFSFEKELYGIYHHLKRDTGKLEGFDSKFQMVRK